MTMRLQHRNVIEFVPHDSNKTMPKNCHIDYTISILFQHRKDIDASMIYALNAI